MDARQKRSQVALHGAIIDLATARAISTLTVSDITDRAGVNRSTFYAHASSASELLCAALSAELDEIRDEFLGQLRDGAPTAETIRGVTGIVLRHLESHRDLYLLAFDDAGGDAGLRAMLTSHFRRSVVATLATTPLVVPDEVPEEFMTQATASFLAAGSTGLMEAWLRQPTPRDPEAYLRAYAHLLPPWWPFAAPTLPA